MKKNRIPLNLIAVVFLAICAISASAGTLSQLPLSLKSGVPPNIMFALSVEFPTAITPAYGKNSSNSTDSSYSRTNTYLGYFDNTKCYQYNASANSIAFAGSTTTVTGWFQPVGFAATVGNLPNGCVGTNWWSGNFLNWVSMSAIDEFRFAMTGGNRVVDLGNTSITNGLTVLERSYQTNQGSNFITKQFTEDGATTKYPSGSILTINSKGNGVQMVVSHTVATPTDTAICITPGGTHGCDGSGAFKFLTTGDLATCTAWSGSGTSGSPYQCTSFTDLTGTTLTNPPTTNTSVIPEVVPTGYSGSGACSLPITGNYYWAICTLPSDAGSAFGSELSPGPYTFSTAQQVFYGDTTNNKWNVINLAANTSFTCSNTYMTGIGLSDPDVGTAKSCYTHNPPASSAANGMVTANCTTMYSGNPSCTFTLTDTSTSATISTTGSCSQWTGAGTLSSPYKCASFGAFSSATEYFSITSLPSASSSFTQAVASNFPNSSVTCSVSYNSTTPKSSKTTCTGLDGNNTTATCSGSYTGKGSSASNAYTCSSFSVTSPSTDTIISSTISCNSTTNEGTKYFCTSYTFNSDVPSTQQIYYSTPYSGIYVSTGTYLYSNYSVTFGTSETFNVRAQVCNPTVGVESNCSVYADGLTYKPSGVLQNNGNSMRFGVTSYFNANDIDNAVLRAKAKYLAPQQYLSAGTFTPNAAAEWSATDGTFINNPDSADSASWGVSGTNSGVINYINQFGTVSKGYKTYDDIGKLYYETLKYLRGGNYTGASSGTFTPAPTTAFYNGAMSSNSDGFPVIKTWDDPVQYACQKNYIITMGDVHTWCDKRLPGGTYSSNGSGVCNAYTDKNGNAHPSDLGSLSGDTGIIGTINGTSVSGTNDATNAVGSLEGVSIGAQNLTGAGGASFYMPGLAAWAASNNIRPDKTTGASPMHVKSFVIDVQEAGDCAYQKHFWLSSKYGDPGNYTFNSTGASAWSGGPVGAANTWSNSIPGNSISCSSNSPPNYGTSSTMSWPKNLLRAGDPVSMINSVNSMIQTIAAEQGAEAALAQSAGTLDTGTGAYIYQGAYNSGGWIGDLKAFVINQNGVVSPTPDWSASQKLPNPNNRNVYSFNRTTRAGINFAPDSGGGLTNFDTYQQSLLNTSNIGVADSFGVDRVNYIRGDMTNEAYLPSTTGATTSNTLTNHGWRSRVAEGVSGSQTPASSSGPTGQLGDIIDSNPVYVGAPSSSLPDATYKAYALAHASRTPVVYVGANDGMLHAFNASYTINSTNGLPTSTTNSGNEIFGYVPYANFPTLSNLMSPNYAHTFYVDGGPVVADVCTSSLTTGVCDGTSSDGWETILVGGLNAGGKGIYALNITDPVAGFSNSNILWEFTSLDDPDLGYTFSQPQVVKLNNGHWAVIFGNGFNSVDPTGNPNNNNAYLFILYVDPKLSSTPGWVLNTNYFKIALPSPNSPNNPSNGLASVASVDVNLDGTTDLVYGGDRNGNMWKIDLSSSTPSQWTVAFSVSPLFIAKDSVGNLQQITTAPKVGRHPNGGYIVTFGSGSWIDTTDPNPQSGSTFNTNTLYGIWDQNTGLTSSPAIPATPSATNARSLLQRQAILGTYSIDNTGASCTAGTSNCTTYTIPSSCTPNYTTTPMPNPGSPLIGNQTSLCPQYVPIPPAYTSYSSVALASPTGTTQQFGWYFDLPGNGERSFSNPPTLSGTNIQFMSLTPSTDPCSGNTSGFQYNFSYLTGAAPSPVFIPIGSLSLATAGTISTSISGATVTAVLGGRSISGGAAQNPITFNANDQAAASNLSSTATTAAPGMPTAAPANCSAGNCTATNYYIPGWGFLMNLPQGPSSSTGRISISCTNNGNGNMTCYPGLRSGEFGRLSWKQIN